MDQVERSFEDREYSALSKWDTLADLHTHAVHARTVAAAARHKAITKLQKNWARGLRPTQ
jgi:hypothetical protein